MEIIIVSLENGVQAAFTNVDAAVEWGKDKKVYFIESSVEDERLKEMTTYILVLPAELIVSIYDEIDFD